MGKPSEAKRQKLLARKKRKQQRKTRSTVVGPRTMSSSLWKKTTRDHPDVLQNIEFVLVNAYRELRGIDDLVVLQALQAAQRRVSPPDPLADEILDELGAIRALRSDVSDSVWRDCLAAVEDSVGNHSTCRPGATGYLDFVKRYVV